MKRERIFTPKEGHINPHLKYGLPDEGNTVLCKGIGQRYFTARFIEGKFMAYGGADNPLEESEGIIWWELLARN